MEVLAKTEKYIPRIIKEAVEIKKHKNNFNRDDSFKLSPTWIKLFKDTRIFYAWITPLFLNISLKILLIIMYIAVNIIYSYSNSFYSDEGHHKCGRNVKFIAQILYV